MKDIKKDFESFANQESFPSASRDLLAKVKTEIQKTIPSTRNVLVKLFALHLVASILSLSLCPQFGVKLFMHGHGLMHYFMQVSETYCYTMCGAFYLAFSFILVRFFMTFDEWLVIKRSRAVMIMGISLVSLGAFALHSREINFELGLLWLFGATVGGELVSLSKTEWRAFPGKIFSLRTRGR